MTEKKMPTIAEIVLDDKEPLVGIERVAEMLIAERQDVIARVLEIIDNVAHTAFAAEDYHHNEGGKCVIQLIREAVEELKGGDQE